MTKEIAKTAPANEIQARINQMVENRKYVIDQVRPMLQEGIDVYVLPGMKKPSLGKPGAEKLASIFGLQAAFFVDKETMDAVGYAPEERKYVAYICKLSRNGEFAGEGRGATFIEWMRNSYRKVYKKDFGTLTDADKAAGELIKTVGKYGEYEFYKIPEAPVFDDLAMNKAIKMAEKSAFVDAVIRTTGCSELFTQDIEDMDMSMYEDAPVETAATEPQKPAATPPAAKPTEPAAPRPATVEQDGFKTCTNCQMPFTPDPKFPKTATCSWKCAEEVRDKRKAEAEARRTGAAVTPDQFANELAQPPAFLDAEAKK